MSSQIKCPAEEYIHNAGVSQAGIRKHIYSCRALKKKTEQTLVFQCQYCSLHFFLNKKQLEEHTEICSISQKEKIPWSDKLHMIIIEPDPNMKTIDQPQACKNWEYYRDMKQKKKQKKLLTVQQPSNDSPTSPEQNRSQSPSNIDSPRKEKKIKQTSEPPMIIAQDISPEVILKQEKLRIENEEKMRIGHVEEMRSRMKVDDYQDMIFD